jgi:hypothetical protein
MVHAKLYMNQSAALEAAGRSERDTHAESS